MEDHDKLNKNARIAFTIIELLVVIAIIALLMSVLMPALSVARSQGKAVICQSNIRQLALANIGYAVENDGYYVPASVDFLADSTGGLHRWHGVRKSSEELFDPLKGPLASYLADGKVKECPEKVKFMKGQNWNINYEQGCGGYGYNQVYIGSRVWQLGSYKAEAYEKTTRVTEVARPAEVIMFADCAMANKESTGNKYIHEYSFAEPPFWLNNGKPATSWGYASPSIHFRHRNKANIGWVDGHISSESRTEYNGINGYGVKSADFAIGWFGPLDNSLFDLK
jgi:prepilin-type processing-associated H-X9-DG protein